MSLENAAALNDSTQKPTSRFQFSLRTLFVFVFAFALGFVARNLASGLHPFAMQLTLPSSTSPVQPGDVLLVESSSFPNLNRRVTVLADGTIAMPDLGVVPIAGQDITAVTQTLTDDYKEFYQYPAIQVYRADASVPLK